MSDGAVLALWRHGRPWRAEHALVRTAGRATHATGGQAGVSPVPYRLAYEVATVADGGHGSLHAVAEGEGWRRALRLWRDGALWRAEAEREGADPFGAPPGPADAAALAGATDVDLGFSPLFNTLPLRRLGLAEGGAATIDVAWVSVPDLAVRPARQTYAVTGPGRVRFAQEGFRATLRLADDGLVERYPGIARRVRP